MFKLITYNDTYAEVFSLGYIFSGNPARPILNINSVFIKRVFFSRGCVKNNQKPRSLSYILTFTYCAVSIAFKLITFFVKLFEIAGLISDKPLYENTRHLSKYLVCFLIRLFEIFPAVLSHWVAFWLNGFHKDFELSCDWCLSSNKNIPSCFIYIAAVFKMFS